MHKEIDLITCSFTVAATDSGGLGITGLTGPTVQAVYMHTSATPATGNPNPAAGYIVVQLQDNYNGVFDVIGSSQAAVTGSALSVNSGLTAGNPYQITVLDATTTAANWITLGVPTGITPAVGVSFVALATGAGSGTTAKVKAIGNSGADSFQTVGNSNLTANPNPASTQGYGASFIIECSKNGALATPNDGAVITLAFMMNNSSVTINGQP